MDEDQRRANGHSKETENPRFEVGEVEVSDENIPKTSPSDNHRELLKC